MEDSMVVWNMHKAYIGGDLIQLGSRAKKERTQCLDAITADIKNINDQNKANPTPHLTSKLFNLRQELHSLHLHTFEKSQRKLKANIYNTGNKAGKAMDRLIKGRRAKSKIQYLFHPTTNEKLINPQAIADAFSVYYSTLYNIQEDKNTHQPSQGEIDFFLTHISLPKLNDSQLVCLKRPFHIEQN